MTPGVKARHQNVHVDHECPTDLSLTIVSILLESCSRMRGSSRNTQCEAFCMKCAPTTAINEQLTSNVVKATEGRDVSHSQEAGGSPIIFYPTKRTAVTSRFEFILAEVGSSIVLNESSNKWSFPLGQVEALRRLIRRALCGFLTVIVRQEVTHESLLDCGSKQSIRQLPVMDFRDLGHRGSGIRSPPTSNFRRRAKRTTIPLLSRH